MLPVSKWTGLAIGCQKAEFRQHRGSLFENVELAYKTIFKIGEYNIVTRDFLRYTFGDVISSRSRTNLSHTADAALVAFALHINKLECFSTFYPLKSEMIFLEAVKSRGQTFQVDDFA